MSLNTRLSDLVTAVGTDYKQLRVWLTGSSSGDLTALTTTAKNSIVAAVNEVNAKPVGNTPGAATETQAGVAEIATAAEVTAGTTDAHIITPLKLVQKLTAWAQPLSNNLTTLSGVVSGAFGRTLLGTVDAPAAKTALGLAAVATSGSASDITIGTLPSSVLPPLAINETFTAATQAAMLALTAQRGDMAIRSDLGGKFFILITDSPSTLADWKPVVSSSDVTSVAGRTGAVTLAKADVGLANVDNTSDASKPVSTVQQTAIDGRLLKTANLSDVTTPATALANIGGVASTAIGDPEANLVTVYNTAKA